MSGVSSISKISFALEEKIILEALEQLTFLWRALEQLNLPVLEPLESSGEADLSLDYSGEAELFPYHP